MFLKSWLQKREDERIAGIKTELALVEADIQRVMKATEEAGARNDVTTTLALVKQSEVLEQSKQALILVSIFFEDQLPKLYFTWSLCLSISLWHCLTVSRSSVAYCPSVHCSSPLS